MALKKGVKTGKLLATDQFGKTGEDYQSEKPVITSEPFKPFGSASVGKVTDITNLPKEEAKKVQLENALIGQGLKSATSEEDKSLVKNIGGNVGELINQARGLNPLNSDFAANLAAIKASNIPGDKLAGQGEGLVGTAQEAGAGFGGALAGAGTGAAIGSIAGPPGTIIGGGVGAVIGGASAVTTKMSFSKKQEVKNANTLYKNAKSNMGKIITAVNKGSITPEDAIIQFNQQKEDIALAKRHLKMETQSSLDRFLSGGMEELIALESWEAYNIPVAEQGLRNAILNPNPNISVSFDEPNVEGI